VNFAAPQLLPLVVLLPTLAAAAAAWLLARRARAEAAWVGGALAGRLRAGGTPRARWLPPLLVALTLAGLTLALARPRWGESTETVERRGLDIVFVVDTSLSMNATDVVPSRFWLAQSLVRRLVAALPGHRVGLVAAEGEGEVLTPLTVDGAVVDLVLDALAPGSLPLPGTHLAPSLERAIELFPESNESHRLVVLLSDGENHGHDLDRAVRALGEAKVEVLAIGIGSERGAPLPLPGTPGQFKRDRHGEVVVSRLHAETLRQLAKSSGGAYFEAASPSFDLAPVALRIAALGGRKIEANTVNSLEERYQWPLAGATLALVLALMLSPYRWRRPEAA
jgi:Ca-activated chloride channel family protein